MGEYLPSLAERRGLLADLVLGAFRLLPVEWVPEAAYATQGDEARRRMADRDPDDWPVVALALARELPIWSQDRDLEAAGVPIYTTGRLLDLLRESEGSSLQAEPPLGRSRPQKVAIAENRALGLRGPRRSAADRQRGQLRPQLVRTRDWTSITWRSRGAFRRRPSHPSPSRLSLVSVLRRSRRVISRSNRSRARRVGEGRDWRSSSAPCDGRRGGRRAREGVGKGRCRRAIERHACGVGIEFWSYRVEARLAAGA